MKNHLWYVIEVTDILLPYNEPEFIVKLKFKIGRLLKTHRWFAHTTPATYCTLLKKANTKQYDKTAPKYDGGRYSETLAALPWLTMHDDMQFNNEAILDLFWIEKLPQRPLLYAMYRGTYSSAQFVPGEDSESVWIEFITCWTFITLGFQIY